MEKIVDLKKYKEAKAVIPHLEAILKVFTLTIAALTRFKAYIPVAKVLVVVEDQRLILESHLKKYKNILNDKK